MGIGNETYEDSRAVSPSSSQRERSRLHRLAVAGSEAWLWEGATSRLSLRDLFHPLHPVYSMLVIVIGYCLVDVVGGHN